MHGGKLMLFFYTNQRYAVLFFHADPHYIYAKCLDFSEALSGKSKDFSACHSDHRHPYHLRPQMLKLGMFHRPVGVLRVSLFEERSLK